MPPPNPAHVRPPTGSLRTMPEMLYVWRIFRIKTGPANLVATVRAPDGKIAVMVAAVKLRLTDPEKVKRLAAFRLHGPHEQRQIQTSLNRRGSVSV
jgi:hypothetical protein